MDYLSESYLNYKPMSITSLIGPKGKKQLSMRMVSLDKIAEYATEDADITVQLYEYLNPKVKADGLQSVYDEIDGPLIRVLAKIERNGINLNADYLDQYSVELGKLITSEERSIYEMAGTPFNISSPKQVGEVLFDKLNIPYRWRKTSSGQYSTSEEKLQELSTHHSIIEKILQYRMLTKLKSTYVDALPKLINSSTGRIHSSFSQTIAATGRLSSKDPKSSKYSYPSS